MICLPHKLLIDYKIDAPRKYKKFLVDVEIVTSIPNNISLTVENIGKETFPGGKISQSSVYFEQFVGMATLTETIKVPMKIPALEPGETFKIIAKRLYALSVGVGKIRIKIEANDDAKVEYYQAKGNPPLKSDEWEHSISAVDRHQLDLTLLFQKFLNKKER